MKLFTTMTKITIFSFLLFSVCCLPIGCSKNPYKTYPVTGKILVDGQPMDGVNVIFIPVDSASGMTAGGLTDVNGEYKLTVAGAPTDSGALAGEYYVTLSKVLVENAEISEEEYEKYSATGRSLPDGPTYKTVIPEKFGRPNDSGIPNAVVEQKKGNRVDIEIETK